MKIIKNVLKNNKSLEIKNTLTYNEFPWFISKGIVFENKDDYQFVHLFYDKHVINSSFFNSLITPILEILNPVSIIRIKANLLIKSKKIIEHDMHVDIENNHSKTAIYYVNTNNGYTKFENNKKILSEENKLVIFNSNVKHCGTTCTNDDYRIVINFNYFER
jgi:hypothetical protein